MYSSWLLLELLDANRKKLIMGYSWANSIGSAFPPPHWLRKKSLRVCAFQPNDVYDTSTAAQEEELTTMELLSLRNQQRSLDRNRQVKNKTTIPGKEMFPLLRNSTSQIFYYRRKESKNWLLPVTRKATFMMGGKSTICFLLFLRESLKNLWLRYGDWPVVNQCHASLNWKGRETYPSARSPASQPSWSDAQMTPGESFRWLLTLPVWKHFYCSWKPPEQSTYSWAFIQYTWLPNYMTQHWAMLSPLSRVFHWRGSFLPHSRLFHNITR